MEFNHDEPTLCPEVNLLSGFVIDAIKPTGDERRRMEIGLSANGTLGEIIARAAYYAISNGVKVPESLVRDAEKAAAELDEPVPDYALPDLDACI